MQLANGELTPDNCGKLVSINDWTNRSDIANLLTQWSSGPGEESESLVQESACCNVDRRDRHVESVPRGSSERRAQQHRVSAARRNS